MKVAALSIQSLCLYREDTQVLSELNLEVGEEQILGLVGNSGCGKSSLLYAIAGLLPLKSGNIFWKAENINRIPPHRRQFGLVFQDHLLFPHKNVSQNLAFGLKMAGWQSQEIEERVAELLEILNLCGFENRNVLSLSGGQAQRVSLGRALAPKPKLLLLDEPLAALDQTLRDTLASEIREIIKSQKIPVIYVTHDLREVFFVADRLALMRDGVIHIEDEPAKMYENINDSYTATFFGLGNQFKVEVGVDGELICPWGSYQNHTLPKGISRILIKPEDIFLLESTPNSALESTGREVALPGKVRNARFLGSNYLIEVEIGKDIYISAESNLHFPPNSKCFVLLEPQKFISMSCPTTH